MSLHAQKAGYRVKGRFIMSETSTLESLVLSEKDFRAISDMVYKHCGINLHEGKKELVRARLGDNFPAKRLR